jgi:hypothetical protein
LRNLRPTMPGRMRAKSPRKQPTRGKMESGAQGSRTDASNLQPPTSNLLALSFSTTHKIQHSTALQERDWKSWFCLHGHERGDLATTPMASCSRTAVIRAASI